jgi:2-dehydropantoate 2-reductase
LLGRSWHLDAIRDHGLLIDGLWGTHRVTHLETATRPEALPRSSPWDWIFVCVKAHQTREAAQALPALLGPATLVCSFQNGLGNDDTLTQRLDPSRVALARVIFGVKLSPGHAHVTVCGDDVLIGAPEARVPETSLRALAETLTAAGIPARVTPAILQTLWAKVLYNCALNGLSTLLEVPYGRLLDSPQAARLMRAVIEEGYRVAPAQGIALDPPTAQAYWELLTGHLIPRTAAHEASMLQDVRAGKPTEIDALNGALARLGQSAGIPTPANALLARLVHSKEAFLIGGTPPPRQR